MSEYNLTNLPVDTSDSELSIMIDVALSWVKENTTIKIDPEAELPSNVKLFVLKFCDLMTQTVGIASESLGGMSQSFSSSGGTVALLADLATQIFGSAYKGGNRFVSAQSRWK